MKNKEVPPVMVWSFGAAVLVLICIGVYFAFLKPPPQTDAAKIDPVRLKDPDPHSKDAEGWNRN